MMLIIFPIFIAMIGPLLRSDPNAPPELVAFFAALMVAALVFSLLFGLPPLLAGYAMLKRKRWAKDDEHRRGVCRGDQHARSGRRCASTRSGFTSGRGQDFHGGGYDAPPAPDWRGTLRDGSAYDWEAQRASQQQSRPREYTPPQAAARLARVEQLSGELKTCLN